MIDERRRTLAVRWSESIEAERSRWAFFTVLSIQQIFMGYKTDHLVLLRVPDNAQRIQTFLNRFDGFLIETTQKNNAAIRITQMFLRPIVDRTLAFLRDPILISACKPTDGFIPFVDSGFALDKSLLSCS